MRKEGHWWAGLQFLFVAVLDIHKWSEFFMLLKLCVYIKNCICARSHNFRAGSNLCMWLNFVFLFVLKILYVWLKNSSFLFKGYFCVHLAFVGNFFFQKNQ